MCTWGGGSRDAITGYSSCREPAAHKGQCGRPLLAGTLPPPRDSPHRSAWPRVPLQSSHVRTHQLWTGSCSAALTLRAPLTPAVYAGRGLPHTKQVCDASGCPTIPHSCHTVHRVRSQPMGKGLCPKPYGDISSPVRRGVIPKTSTKSGLRM